MSKLLFTYKKYIALSSRHVVLGKAAKIAARRGVARRCVSKKRGAKSRTAGGGFCAWVYVLFAQAST
jgi:hypothetical protein